MRGARQQAHGPRHFRPGPIAFDEWNLRGWHHPPGNDAQALEARRRNDRHETYTMADAVFSAGFLNGCIRNADVVSMANLAPLVNGRGPLFADDHGVVKRTTFHAMYLYSRLLGAEHVESTGHSVALDCGDGVSIPAVDTVATRTADGALVVALVNRDPERALDCRVDVDGVLQLPAHSITILTVDGAVPDAEPAQAWVRGPGRGWRARQTSTDPNGSRVDFAY